MPNIVAIFAHPDDESFGPGGTIAQLSKTHNVYTICATSGDAGGDPHIREHELHSACSVLGVKEAYCLHYADGTLSNNQYHDIAKSVEQIINRLTPTKLLTFEPRGVTGHIDHVVMSMVTSYLFHRLTYIDEAWYYCISNEHRVLIGDYFVYVPDGYARAEVDVINDVSDVWPIRMKCIDSHVSQVHDAESLKKILQQLPKEEYFLVKRR